MSDPEALTDLTTLAVIIGSILGCIAYAIHALDSLRSDLRKKS